MNPTTIIASNRLPVTVSVSKDEGIRIDKSTGGLVAALREVHSKDDCLWVGHCGLFTTDPEFQAVKKSLDEQRFLTVPIQKKSYKGFYNGTSNGAIWPLSHYFTASIKVTDEDWRSYVEVNERFAEAILSVARKDCWIWIHDYQLMLLPGLLRLENSDLKIAYFHHIPFPSSEIFRLLSFREPLLRGLLGADLVGVHTFDYARHFLNSVVRIVGCETHVDEVQYGGRIVKVGAFPLGVDVDHIKEVLEEGQSSEDIAKFVEGKGDRLFFLGVDRLDYTKGIPERLMAFREFLKQHPEFAGKVSLLQLCVPSRAEISAYGNLKSTVERLVGQINGEFGRPGYTPIEYMYASFSESDVFNLYRQCEVALITPLRDGLNLVCKEYIAARDNDEGVVILSEFAGAAAEMGEAILVNPLDQKDMVRAMYSAVTMSTFEKSSRMKRLRRRITEYNNIAWSNSFQTAWKEASGKNSLKSKQILGKVREDLVAKIRDTKKFCVFLDYDGTLTPIVNRPELAIPSDQLLQLLKKVCSVSNWEVTLVTGRGRDFCETYFSQLPMHIVAEHGGFYRSRGISDWESQVVVEEFHEIKPDILRLLELYTRCVPGTWIEEKELSLVWHYRLAEQVFAKSQSMELTEALVNVLGKTSYSVFRGKKNIEIRAVTANKGHAIEQMLNRFNWNQGEIFMSVGDDKTDEDMHKVNPSENISIHVGKPSIYAKYYLSSPELLCGFLDELIS